MSTLQPSSSPSPTRPSFLRDVDDGDDSSDGGVSQRSISLSSPRHSGSAHSSWRESREGVATFHTIGNAQVNTPTVAEFHPLGNRLEDKDKQKEEEKGLAHGTRSAVDTSETTYTLEHEREQERELEAVVSPSTNSSLSHDETRRSSQTSITTSSINKYHYHSHYPPHPTQTATAAGVYENDTASMISYASTTSSSRKARPESMLVEPPIGPIVPGIALVDFNHLVGPKIEFSDGAVFNDEQLTSILPFLALPDGAHLSSEDYSYFHLVPASPHPTTIFGISCNRQIKTSELLVKEEDMTRSTVQKAVVVLASKPVFGPIRDRLGVVTQALFSQRDFREMGILVDFKSSLEMSLRNQLTESALYMGTNLRELVHKFRSRTLLLLKSLMLQKRIMFFGHPVERLCTYQYSLISLIPGLLQNLDDCGSPPLASRALTLSPPTSLRTSDRKSLMAYLGLPLDIFGKDAFFQPYLPLQQVDIIKDTRSYLCGSTNTIVTQQKEIDLLVNIETNTFEFRDPQLERLVALTAADRKWMDAIVKDVNDTWDETDPGRSTTVQFKGSDDYIRTKFEEYVSAALALVKYQDFLLKSSRSDVVITGADGGDANAIQDFNPQWIAEFRRTNAYEVWNRITDPMIFDIVEARHPCSTKPSVVEDIGLRLQEGFQDLHIQEQLAPTREAISRTLATGSTNFLKAVEGVRGRWAAQRSASSLSAGSTSSSTSTPMEISRSEADLSRTNSATSGDVAAAAASPPKPASSRSSTFSTFSSTFSQGGLRPLSLSSASNPSSSTSTSSSAAASAGAIPSTGSVGAVAADAKATIGAWGSSIGSFISQRTARLSVPRTNSPTGAPATGSANNVSSGAAAAGASASSLSQTDKTGNGTIVESPTSLSYAHAHDSGGVAGEGEGQKRGSDGGTGTSTATAESSTPLTSLFSSWSFGKASAAASVPAKPVTPSSPPLSQSAPLPPLPSHEAEPEPEIRARDAGAAAALAIQPRDLGEVNPVNRPSGPPSNLPSPPEAQPLTQAQAQPQPQSQSQTPRSPNPSVRSNESGSAGEAEGAQFGMAL